LRCTIFETTLDEAPEYEAISYVWGDCTNPVFVICDTQGGMLRVPPNLKAALLRFRIADKPRTLWMDSICINQDDLTERSNHVRLMGPIYKKASTVLIWLGEEDEYFVGLELHETYRTIHT